MTTTSDTPSRRAGRTEAAPYVAIGGFCGLAWAAGLRGWMAQLAREGGGSSFTWLTFVLVLAPGLAIGLLLGWAAYLRSVDRSASRWLVWTPALFASALLDPEISRALIRNGEGGGALMVVFTALAIGFVLSRRRWSVGRVLCAVVAVLGLLLLGSIGSMAGPVTSPRGAWVCLFGLTLMLLFGLASVLPYPRVRAPRGPWSFAGLGALVGLAWACALRSFMAEVVGPDSQVHWVNTFGFILLPGVAIGALLGWAEFLRRTGGRPGWRRLAWSPLLFGAILLSNPLDIGGLLEDGVGGGAIAVPLICMAAGHGISGRGRVWTRALGVLFGIAAITAWALTATAAGGDSFALTTPHGLWATILYYCLLATLALGASVPLRQPVTPGSPPLARLPSQRVARR